jgi:hypothetical protein
MYTFLVLGLIPGTNIQIGFWGWAIIMIALAIVFRIYKSRLTRYVKSWWHQFDDELDELPRKPLHASRLHLRGL